MNNEYDTGLAQDQRGRVEALKAARQVLTAEARVMSSGSLPDRFDVIDLVDLAAYIMGGTHPTQRFEDTQKDEPR